MSLERNILTDLPLKVIESLFPLIEDGKGKQFVVEQCPLQEELFRYANDQGESFSGYYNRSTKKKVTTTELAIYVMELVDGTNVYFHPTYTVKKINGSTHRIDQQPKFLRPANAKRVIRLDVSYTGEQISLSKLNIEVEIC